MTEPTENLPATALEAAERGLRHYRGRPCRHGHQGIRYAVNGDCVICAKLRVRAERGRRQRELEQAQEG